MPQRVLFLGKALVVLKMRGMLWQNQKGKVVLHRCVQSLRYKLVNESVKLVNKKDLVSKNFALRCDIHPSYVGHIERGMQNPTLSTLERISQGLGISMDDLFKDIDTPINVENAAIRHLSQVISELSPEQTQQLLQIVDSVMAIKNEYL